MHASDAIIFALTHRIEDHRYLASIVSHHRSIDITFIHNSWVVKACIPNSVELTCGTLPMESVTYVDDYNDLGPSTEYLIRWSGQNHVELQVTSPVEGFELPVFLSTGQAIQAYRYPIRVRLRTRCWADVPDFQAGQAYWIRRYQKLIANGQSYLQTRLADYQREREIAAALEIGTGDALPVTVRGSTATSAPGCLLIGERETSEIYRGTLSVLGEQDLSRCSIERHIRWEESGKVIEKGAIIADIVD